MEEVVRQSCDILSQMTNLTSLALGPDSRYQSLQHISLIPLNEKRISPVLAFLLGIAPQILTVPAIMAGNTVYVVLLYVIAGNSKSIVRKVIAWVVAAAAKFAALYAIVVGLICGVLSEGLLAAGTLKEPMLKALPATFSWPQLITALIGGAVALLIVPVLRKALKK